MPSTPWIGILQLGGRAPARRRRAGRHILQRRNRFKPGDGHRRAQRPGQHKHLFGGLRRRPHTTRAPMRAWPRPPAARVITSCASQKRSSPTRSRGWSGTTTCRSISPIPCTSTPSASWPGSDVTVVLTGEGADELFGGYPRYYIPRLLAPLASLPVALRAAVGPVLAELPGSSAAQARRIRCSGNRTTGCCSTTPRPIVDVAARACCADGTDLAVRSPRRSACASLSMRTGPCDGARGARLPDIPELDSRSPGQDEHGDEHRGASAVPRQ